MVIICTALESRSNVLYHDCSLAPKQKLEEKKMENPKMRETKNPENQNQNAETQVSEWMKTILSYSNSC